jgi:serine/threonine protein kinase
VGHRSDPLIGTKAGNYRLVERLGAGGMGEVYKGLHDAIGAKVAIKLLHATAAHDIEAQKRFLLEAQAVNRVEHPGVVKIIDAGRTDAGRPFLVMELLDGSSFHELRKRGAMTMRDACRGMVDVLDAIHAAHQAGVVHRDLKPPNLFRTREGRVVVLDFGVAKLMAPDASVRLTHVGTAIGTPHYMAPEQIRGKTVTPSSDIYAAGVVLFELVCGRRPFDDPDDSAVMAGHLEKRPPVPRAFNAAIPEAVEAVILAALEKEPASRFASAAAMRDALRTASDSIAADAAPPPQPARSPWARPAGGAAVAAQEAVSRDRAPHSGQPTVPNAKIPVTDPDSTPSGVLVHRERSRLTWLVLVSAAVVALVGGLALYQGTRGSDAEPTSTGVQDDAHVATADAAPGVPVDAFLASLVNDAGVHHPAKPGPRPVPGTPSTSTRRSDPDDLIDPSEARGSSRPPPSDARRDTRISSATISSKPSGAAIMLDGSAIGVTPWRGTLAVGTHRMSIVVTGFRPHTQTIVVTPNRPFTFDVPLVREPEADLPLKGFER